MHLLKKHTGVSSRSTSVRGDNKARTNHALFPMQIIYIAFDFSTLANNCVVAVHFIDIWQRLDNVDSFFFSHQFIAATIYLSNTEFYLCTIFLFRSIDSFNVHNKAYIQNYSVIPNITQDNSFRYRWGKCITMFNIDKGYIAVTSGDILQLLNMSSFEWLNNLPLMNMNRSSHACSTYLDKLFVIGGEK